MSDLHDPLPDDLRERAGIVTTNGQRNLLSPSPSLSKGSGRRDDGPKLVRLVDVEAPGPRRYLLRDLVLAAYVTLLYGDGGVAKSLLASSWQWWSPRAPKLGWAVVYRTGRCST